MSEKKQKIGAGHASAAIRQGGKEFGQILPAFPANSVQTVEEPGLVGNLTPQEVVNDKGGYEAMLNGYASRGHQQQGRDQERE
jgi:hypothetical protein